MVFGNLLGYILSLLGYILSITMCMQSFIRIFLTVMSYEAIIPSIIIINVIDLLTAGVPLLAIEIQALM